LAALGPLQESMRVALSFTDNQMALLQGPTRVWPQLLTAVPLGLIIDRQSRVRLLWVFALVTAAASGATALLSSFAWLFAARSLVGLAGAGTLTAAISLLADLYGPAQRGRAMTVLGIGQVAGSAAAFAAGGTLLTIIRSGAAGWQGAMLWLALPLVATSAVIFALQELPRTDVVVERPAARAAFAELWSYRAVIAPLLGGVVIIDIAYGAAYLWAAPAMSRRFMLAPDRVGAIVGAVLLISGILGPIAGGLLADTCQRTGGPRRTMAVLGLLALASVPFGLFALTPGVVAASVSLAIFLTLLPAISLMVTTLCTVVIPNELRGLCIALLNAVCDSFAFMLAPVLVSVLAGALGGPAMLGRAVSIACGFTAVMGAVTFGIGRRYLPEARDL